MSIKHKHIIYTRFRYLDKKMFDYRFDLFRETLLLSLLLQKNRNFLWQIQTTSRDKNKIARYTEDLNVEYLEQNGTDNPYWGHYLFVYDKGHNIQSRLDSDDILHPMYIEIIQNMASNIGDEKNVAVNFEYRRMRWGDGKMSNIGGRCRKRQRCSMFLSLINPDGMTVNTGRHHQMSKHASRVIWIEDPEYATLVCHGKNKSSKFR